MRERRCRPKVVEVEYLQVGNLSHGGRDRLQSIYGQHSPVDMTKPLLLVFSTQAIVEFIELWLLLSVGVVNLVPRLATLGSFILYSEFTTFLKTFNTTSSCPKHRLNMPSKLGWGTGKDQERGTEAPMQGVEYERPMDPGAFLIPNKRKLVMLTTVWVNRHL